MGINKIIDDRGVEANIICHFFKIPLIMYYLMRSIFEIKCFWERSFIIIVEIHFNLKDLFFYLIKYCSFCLSTFQSQYNG